MTIDEMIEEQRENAKTQREIAEECFEEHIFDEKERIEHLRYANEYEQLAEWLEELNELRNMTAGHLYAVAFNRGYLKAEKEVREKSIDDFAKWLENKKYLMKEIQEHNFCYTHYDELKANYVVTEYFEEQLKAGVDNV